MYAYGLDHGELGEHFFVLTRMIWDSSQRDEPEALI